MNENLKRLEQKIDELSEKIEVVLDRQNTQYTDIMLFLKNNLNEDMTTIDDRTVNQLYDLALNAVREAGKASTSYIQRKLKIGYSRASCLIELLEERGVIGPENGGKPREIIGNNQEKLNK
jgi:DNA segregation ATPase FtsK/SpoIIIE, S-DNA-T family